MDEKFSQILRMHLRVDDQQQRQFVQEPDWREIVRWIVAEVLIERRADAERKIYYEYLKCQPGFTDTPCCSRGENVDGLIRSTSGAGR